MTSVARAFVAVYPPPDALDALESGLHEVRNLPAAVGVRFVAREQWHVTLRFCGGVVDVDALAGTLAGALAGRDPVTGLHLGGAGAFPSPRRASLCWVGLAPGAPTAALGDLASAVEAACVAAGLAPDDREFHPHVTVARSSRPRDLRALVAALDGALGPDRVGPPWSATAVRLVASDTRPEGAVHSELATIRLRAT